MYLLLPWLIVSFNLQLCFTDSQLKIYGSSVSTSNGRAKASVSVRASGQNAHVRYQVFAKADDQEVGLEDSVQLDENGEIFVEKVTIGENPPSVQQSENDQRNVEQVKLNENGDIVEEQVTVDENTPWVHQSENDPPNVEQVVTGEQIPIAINPMNGEDSKENGDFFSAGANQSEEPDQAGDAEQLLSREERVKDGEEGEERTTTSVERSFNKESMAESYENMKENREQIATTAQEISNQNNNREQIASTLLSMLNNQGLKQAVQRIISNEQIKQTVQQIAETSAETRREMLQKITANVMQQPDLASVVEQMKKAVQNIDNNPKVETNFENIALNEFVDSSLDSEEPGNLEFDGATESFPDFEYEPTPQPITPSIIEAEKDTVFNKDEQSTEIEETMIMSTKGANAGQKPTMSHTYDDNVLPQPYPDMQEFIPLAIPPIEPQSEQLAQEEEWIETNDIPEWAEHEHDSAEVKEESSEISNQIPAPPIPLDTTAPQTTVPPPERHPAEPPDCDLHDPPATENTGTDTTTEASEPHSSPEEDLDTPTNPTQAHKYQPKDYDLGVHVMVVPSKRQNEGFNQGSALYGLSWLCCVVALFAGQYVTLWLAPI